MTAFSAEDSTVQLLISQCRQVVTGKTPCGEAIVRIRETIDKLPSTGKTILLDVLTALNAEFGEPSTPSGTSSTSTSNDARRFLLQVCSELLPADVLSLEMNALGATLPQTNSRVVKGKTRLYYKQVKFNLLREESEGYAKLMTELLAVKKDTTPEQVVTIIERLIGQFNLDPNRVIDLILDCFENCLSLRDLFLGLLRKFKVGREELCNLLALKFIFCQRGNSSTPMDLYRTASLLAQAEMIDLLQLFRMVAPTSQQLLEEHKELAALIKKRCTKAETISSGQLATQSINDASAAMQSGIGDGMNGGVDAPGTNLIPAISFAAAAASQEAEDAKLAGARFDDVDVLAKNQKLGLICALLEHGAWPLAKLLLDRMPEGYAVAVSKRVARALANLVGYTIEPLYRAKYRHWRDSPVEGNGSTSNSSKSWERFTNLQPAQQLSKWGEFAQVLFPMLSYLGPSIALRHEVGVKLMRLIAVYYDEQQQQVAVLETDAVKRELDGVSEDFSPQVSNTMVDICDYCLVPSASLLSAPMYNYCDEMWQILQRFPYQQRYYIYGRWKTVHTMRSWDLAIRRSKVQGMAKYAMKRLSKETAKVIGRQLGKLCHNYPMAVLDYMLDKVQDFQNFIGPVVESMRFLSSMEFDVLAYCLIESLAAPQKQEYKTTDVSFSPWLQSLSAFAASIFKRYQLDVTGLLQYIVNQLKDGKNLDLIVLREIVANSSGVESGTDLTQEHLDALSGGPLLKQETSFGSQARANKKAVSRLKDALLKSDLLEALCILVAQQRNFISYREYNDYPLKLTTHMQDQCQETLVQFHQFMRWHLKPQEWVGRLPVLGELLGYQFLPIESAMLLARSSYSATLSERYEAALGKAVAEKKAANSMDSVESGSANNEAATLPSAAEIHKLVEPAERTSLFKAALDSVVDEVERELRSSLPDSLWVDLAPRMYAIFWLLSISDISAPVSAYEREIEKCKKGLAELGPTGHHSSHLPGESTSRVRRLAKEEERIKQHEQRLAAEMREQVEHVSRVKDALALDCTSLFTCGVAGRSQMLRFLQTCVLPRLLCSEVDAVYCAKLITVLHANRTEHFQTMVFFDKIFVDVGIILTGLTEREAMCFGRFCSLALEIIMRWYSDEAIFRAEGEGFPGCASRVTRVDGTAANVSSIFSYQQLRQICYKWQVRLQRTCTDMLANDNYVCIRNTLTLMTKILSNFPLLTSHYKQVEKVVTELRDKEKGKRSDLNLLASSYLVKLAKRVDVRTYEVKEFYDASRLRPMAQAQSASASSAKTTAVASSRKRGVPINGNHSGSAVNVTATAATTTANGDEGANERKRLRNQ